MGQTQHQVQEIVMRTLVVALAVLAPTSGFAQSTCPTTASSHPQRFIAPAPFQAVRDRGSFWFGSDKLWVQLSESGRWNGLYRADRNVYRNKLPLYRAGFDW